MGKTIVDALNRMDRVRAVHLAEVYGHDQEQGIEDVVFLRDAGIHGWVVLTKDARMWQNPDEREAIRTNRTRVFAMARADYSPAGDGLILGRRMLSIMRRARRADSCFWRLDPNRVRKPLP